VAAAVAVLQEVGVPWLVQTKLVAAQVVVAALAICLSLAEAVAHTRRKPSTATLELDVANSIT